MPNQLGCSQLSANIVFKQLYIGLYQYELLPPLFGFHHTTGFFYFLNPITPTCSNTHPLTFSIHITLHEPAHVFHENMRLQVINQQARVQFRLNVTFKVLFSLYIQYTSQKYTVNLQQRSFRYTIKSAVGNNRFLDEDYKECVYFIIPVFSLCFYICTDVTVEAMLKNASF